VLRPYEKEVFVNILLESKSPYAAFLIVFLKEVNFDIEKVLRILNVASKHEKRIINVTIINFVVTTIKEAIVIANYKNYASDFPDKHIQSMAKTYRFVYANVDRQTIIITFSKYNIKP
jgi:hypothetical protein